MVPTFLVLLGCFIFPLLIPCKFVSTSSAVTEDANRAIELKDGLSVGGRKIGVKHAMQRATLEQRRLKENKGLYGELLILGFKFMLFSFYLLLDMTELGNISCGGVKFSFLCDLFV